MKSSLIYLLDTDTCIYTIKRRPLEVVARVRASSDNQICISSITLSELEYGIQKSKFHNASRDALIRFLVPFEIIEFTSKDAYHFGLIRAHLESIGKIIGPYDLQIAAQAVARNLILVTNNVREFSRIPNLKYENWVNAK